MLTIVTKLTKQLSSRFTKDESFERTQIRFLDGTIFGQIILTSRPNSELLGSPFSLETRGLRQKIESSLQNFIYIKIILLFHLSSKKN